MYSKDSASQEALYPQQVVRKWEEPLIKAVVAKEGDSFRNFLPFLNKHMKLKEFKGKRLCTRCKTSFNYADPRNRRCLWCWGKSYPLSHVELNRRGIKYD